MPDTCNTPAPAGSAEPLTLHFNGTSLTVAASTSLAELLGQQNIAPASVATAVNGSFVPRALRAQHRLRSGDTVLTFQAIVGG